MHPAFWGTCGPRSGFFGRGRRRAHRECGHERAHQYEHEGHSMRGDDPRGPGGGPFGVRRPLRFLAFKLGLEDAQIAQLAARWPPSRRSPRPHRACRSRNSRSDRSGCRPPAARSAGHRSPSCARPSPGREDVRWRCFIRITAAEIIDMLCAMPASTRQAIATGMVLSSTNTSSMAYQASVAPIKSLAMRKPARHAERDRTDQRAHRETR